MFSNQLIENDRMDMEGKRDRDRDGEDEKNDSEYSVSKMS